MQRYCSTRRPGFTLVELLVTLVIIAILASLTLAGLGTVRQRGKEDATRATIRKLHEIIMPMYESYMDRRVPATGAGRLANIRKLLAREMPDVRADVLATQNAVTALTDDFLETGIVRAYASYREAVTGWNDQYETAECLYMIVTRSGFQPEAMEQFRAEEIGDADGDGAPEFHDAWGVPIEFRRWAPGFTSVLQPATPANHDPFDYSNAESAAFALYPLIFSAGLDQSPGISQLLGIGWSSLNLGPSVSAIYNYDGDTGSAGVQPIGTPTGPSAHLDNITNHDLVTR